MEREFCPKSLQDSKSLERESVCSPRENLPRAGWSNLPGYGTGDKPKAAFSSPAVAWELQPHRAGLAE